MIKIITFNNYEYHTEYLDHMGQHMRRPEKHSFAFFAALSLGVSGNALEGR